MIDAYRTLLRPFFDAVPEGSCAAIDIEGERFADVRADLPVIPASNQKLLVAAVALEVLGEDHRFHTELRGAQPVDGVITGDVYLVGGGDPLLVTGDYVDPLPLPAFNTTSLDAIADALQAAGVTQIVGDVVGDGSRYDDEFVVPSWGAEHVLGAEAGPYDALMVNDGRTFADSTIGFNPNQSAARQFIRLLQARNIAVTGRSRNGAAPADGSVTVLGGVDSAPLADVVDELLQTSDNNTAELLVKEIGVAVRGEGTRVAGLQEVWNTLAAWQVPLEGVELDDGSGLSRNDRLTCDAIMAVLEHVGVDSELAASLPVAGVSGTLVGELVGGPADGRLSAKTGTLTGVRALSGFLPTDDGLMTFVTRPQRRRRRRTGVLPTAVVASRHGCSTATRSVPTPTSSPRAERVRGIGAASGFWRRGVMLVAWLSCRCFRSARCCCRAESCRSTSSSRATGSSSPTSSPTT